MQVSQVIHTIGETVLWLVVILVGGLVAVSAVEAFHWYLQWQGLPDPLTLACERIDGGHLRCELAE